MPLNSALQLGRTALTASQLAIQVAGNNVANAATPGYSRQDVTMRPIADTRGSGTFVGRGVEVQSIRRSVDTALQQRLLGGISGEGMAATDLAQLSAVETTLDELGNQGLSTQLTSFFNSWSELANSPNLGASRALVVQQGRSLASFVRTVRGELENQRTTIDRDLQSTTSRVNGLLDEIAGANQSIVLAEGGNGQANGLRDRRDQLVSELARYVDVTTIEQPSGALDVLVGSTPIVLAGNSRGVEFRAEPSANNNGVNVRILTRDNAEELNIRAGQLGSLLNQRDTLVNSTIDELDNIASQVIFQVNRVHSQGVNATGYTSLTGTLPMASADRTLALNDPTNQTMQDLRIRPQSGSFTVRVRNEATGEMRIATVNVDLDGLTGTPPVPGFGTDTSLTSLAGSIDGIANVTASITGDGKLKIDAATGYTVSFGDDTSGALAVLGVNTFFEGTDATNIAIRSELASSPALLATGRFVPRNSGGAGTGDPTLFEADRVDNGAALLIAQVREQPQTDLGGQSIAERWNQTVQTIAVKTGAARTASESATIVKQSLDAQKSAIAGVSMDEEAINLINYQRQYQASARFISVVDEMTQTLLGLVR
jgi:flagellar hook-associated protein 1 FlgK